MSNEIEKYNPTSIMKSVTDKIKVTFAELIPDAEWENLVKKQVTLFFEDKTDRYGTVTQSEFTKMCQELIREVARDHIKTHMEKTYKRSFDKNNNQIDEAVKEMVMNNASKMFTNMMSQAASQAVWNMQNNINNQR